MTDWKELIGKRVLLRHRPLGYVKEVKILELSPSGRYIRIEWMDVGWDEWRDIEEFEFNYKLAEVLD